MEIERKWLIDNFPSGGEFECVFDAIMMQGYISTSPAVRIRKTIQKGKACEYILCFKGKGTLVREEIEIEIKEDEFLKLEKFLGKNLIEKHIKKYKLQNGLLLEVNCVDKGTKTEFYYAEVEFETKQQAENFTPPSILKKEMTYDENFSMRDYWLKTRT